MVTIAISASILTALRVITKQPFPVFSKLTIALYYAWAIAMVAPSHVVSHYYTLYVILASLAIITLAVDLGRLLRWAAQNNKLKASWKGEPKKVIVLRAFSLICVLTGVALLTKVSIQSLHR